MFISIFINYVNLNGRYMRMQNTHYENEGNPKKVMNVYHAGHRSKVGN